MEVKFTRKDPSDFYEFNLPDEDLTYRIVDGIDIDGSWQYRLVKLHPSERDMRKYKTISQFLFTYCAAANIEDVDDEKAVDAFIEMTEPNVHEYYTCTGEKRTIVSKVIRNLDNNTFVTFDPPLSCKSPVTVVRKPNEEPLTSWCKSFKEAKEDAERAVERDIENHVDVQMSLF